MKAIEFCYWLQGAIELCNVEQFTEQMLVCIKKHLELVNATNQDGQLKAVVEFCQWLRGGVDFIKGGNTEQTFTVRSRLNHLGIDTLHENPHLDPIHNGHSSGVRER